MDFKQNWKVGSSSIHGRGLFAVQPIESGCRVVEYEGQRIDKQESIRRCQAGHHCIFYWDAEFDIDGGVEWNPARFANHSCAPNCEAQREGDHIWIVSTRDISAGEEITFNYGYDLEEYRQYPCRCGAANCVGYIVAEEYFDLVRNNTGIGLQLPV
jgi:hypothetical protein